MPGRIHVSDSTHELLPHEQWEPTGGVEVKGKVGSDTGGDKIFFLMKGRKGN